MLGSCVAKPWGEAQVGRRGREAGRAAWGRVGGKGPSPAPRNGSRNRRDGPLRGGSSQCLTDLPPGVGRKVRKDGQAPAAPEPGACADPGAACGLGGLPIQDPPGVRRGSAQAQGAPHPIGPLAAHITHAQSTNLSVREDGVPPQVLYGAFPGVQR